MSFVELADAFNVIVLNEAAWQFPVSPVYDEAVNVTLPETADGVSVAIGSNICRLNAYFGMLSNVIVVAVQAVSLVRWIRTGCRSGCTAINVSALCVQHISSTMLEPIVVVR